MATTTAPAAKQLTLLGFFAITASMVMAVYEYPTFATSGFSLVFFLLLGGLLWFIPVALCAAEMATVEGWEEGGIFAWVSNTLGERWGFAAISFGYLQIAIGFIPMLYFVLGALSYILNWPELNTDPIIKTIAALIILWGLAFTQFGGTKYTATIAKVGFFAGILLPALILVCLAISYLVSGAPLAIEISTSTFIPDFTQIGTLVVFVAFILSYMGVEASATHVNEMKNPGRDYPAAMFLLMIAAICLSSIGGLSVAAVIPNSEINLSAGVVQTFNVLVTHFNSTLEWVARIIAALLLLGVLAEIASWIVGPSRGMYVAAQKGILPQSFAKVNKNGVPVTLVIAQLLITTIAIIVLTNTGGGGNMSFLIALALTVVIYLCSYFMLFLGYMHLVCKQPEKKRAFNIPGGKGFKLLLASAGLIVSVLAFVISFFPPSSLPGGGSDDTYVTLLAVSFVIIFLLPFIVYAFHDKRGKKTGVSMVHIKTHNAPVNHFFIHPRARSAYHLVHDDKPTTETADKK
ncbi:MULTISPECIES: glutamate:gamma-aminobutyrate antiporter [Providencia]|uniref:Glutamate/gamma-aminobutyrate antiporter n=1 Tax=Providencia heimbachae ATCC 35613 TaxID=1354272 RepID=A0A1B7JUR2_9GAMM|nr:MULTISPECIES: glutamate:gamma-aminobutyrate antiporter [Providencia]MBP6122932.1 glutamate:gamma-aminobutyrate antiporter [Providencia sp.]MDD9338222.1 glutamate:gamma-aminobutyrate antiporter [Providencia heimbachae]NIH24417.1 glutamate:gamma-aminobutyrate antiporter [Providencia heimbachae]OAT51650.1 putative glutamate/gamma-aminobutyrate antiporter [Providencia heimbachae ATCC 35613]QCJ71798.1 glutamate:gamma-aminobutyrate antiporter [Providencia heimbachae]